MGERMQNFHGLASRVLVDQIGYRPAIALY